MSAQSDRDPHVLLGRIIDAATDLAHMVTSKGALSEKRDTDQRAACGVDSSADSSKAQGPQVASPAAAHPTPHPDRRTQQVPYPGIDKRKVRGETPRTDAEIEHPQNILIENAEAERRGDKCSYQVVRADFARTLERELRVKTLEANMLRKELGETWGFVAQEKERAETAEAENAALKRDAERWQMVVEGTGAQLLLPNGCRFVLPGWLTGITDKNLMKGAVSGHLNDVADAAIRARTGGKP